MTAGPGAVDADWAWISKDPAVGIGYRVLATSADNVDFGSFVGRYVPGTPSSTASPGAPEAPPWVTFGPVASGRHGVLLSVSVRDRDPRQELDHAGRAVWSQQLLVMRFAELAAAGASFQTMWQEVSKVTVPAHAPGPLQLKVERQELRAVAEVIVRHGFERMAALAAALLDGPVAIADAAPLRREERLAVLDAVAALLPYGYRADLAVSSVVDNTVSHGIRLVFADFASTAQQLISLRADSPSPCTDLSRQYLELLLEKRNARQLEAVLEHLWSVSQPCSFENPDVAVTVLAELDFYGGFSRELQRGRVQRDQALTFFANPKVAKSWWDSYDRPMRDTALSFLARRDPEMARTVLSCWNFTHADITRVINAQLDAADVELADWCLGVAQSAGGNLEDLLLGTLLVPMGQIPALSQLSRRITRLVELLRRRQVPRPGEFRYSCDELRFGDAGDWQAHLVRGLLLRESVESPGRATAWLEWLCRSPFSGPSERPDWIEAFDFVVTESAGPRSAQSARSLLLRDPSWAVTLLRLAKLGRSFPRLVETAEQELIELAAKLAGPQEEASSGALLREELAVTMWDAGVHANYVACVDVARVLLGAAPDDFDGQPDQDSYDSYLDGLSFVFGLAAMAPHRAAVQHAFLRHVVTRRKPGQLTPGGIALLNKWSQDEEQTASLISFIAKLPPEARPYSEHLGEPYWRALGSEPELAGYAAAHRLMIVTRAAARSQPAAFWRAIIDNGVSSTPLARACYRARCEGMPVAEIIGALSEADAGLIEPSLLAATLCEFSELMEIHYRDTDRAPQDAGPCRSPRHAAQADLLEGFLLVAFGAFGTEYSDRFAPYLADLSAGQVHFGWRMRRAIAPRRRRPDQDTAAARARAATTKWLEDTAGGPVRVRGLLLSRPSRP